MIEAHGHLCVIGSAGQDADYASTQRIPREERPKRAEFYANLQRAMGSALAA